MITTEKMNFVVRKIDKNIKNCKKRIYIHTYSIKECTNYIVALKKNKITMQKKANQNSIKWIDFQLQKFENLLEYNLYNKKKFTKKLKKLTSNRKALVTYYYKHNS
jgi:hypothetical protein